MPDKDYTPIACGLYDQFELAIMRGQRLNIHWLDAEEQRFSADLLPLDLRIVDKAEFLIARDEHANQVRLRLDWIESASPSKS